MIGLDFHHDKLKDEIPKLTVLITSSPMVSPTFLLSLHAHICERLLYYLELVPYLMQIATKVPLVILVEDPVGGSPV
jgi:hypothetical protein